MNDTIDAIESLLKLLRRQETATEAEKPVSRLTTIEENTAWRNVLANRAALPNTCGWECPQCHSVNAPSVLHCCCNGKSLADRAALHNTW